MRMTRREWVAAISAAPLVRAAETAAPAAPVAIAKCASYDEDVTAKLASMFDQLGGIERLVRGKTVTVKVNMTGSPGQRVQGKAPAITHYTHPKLLGAAAYLFGRAGAKRVRFVESSWASAGPLATASKSADMIDTRFMENSFRARNGQPPAAIRRRREGGSAP
jgi:hypothetical protein